MVAAVFVAFQVSVRLQAASPASEEVHSARKNAVAEHVSEIATQLDFLERRDVYDERGRLMLKNLRLSELEDWCVAMGERRQRGLQLWRWMYADGPWIRTLEETAGQQDGFSQAFRCHCAQSTLCALSTLVHAKPFPATNCFLCVEPAGRRQLRWRALRVPD
jgi:hypothetical protein